MRCRYTAFVDFSDQAVKIVNVTLHCTCSRPYLHRNRTHTHTGSYLTFTLLTLASVPLTNAYASSLPHAGTRASFHSVH